MTIPRIVNAGRVQILRALFEEMLLPKYKKWIGDWHDKYKLFCESVARAERIDDALLYSLLRKRDNGVAVIGQSTLTKKFYATLETSKKFRDSLESFRQFSDKPHFSKMRDFVDGMASQAGHRKFPLRLNRIAVTFNRELSSFPNEAAFTQTLNWFMSNKLLDFHLAMDWFDDNLRLTRSFTDACSDIPGYDVWNRNMFLWWIFEEYVRPKRPPPEPAMSIPPSIQSHTTAMQKSNSIPVAAHSLNTILCGPPGTGKTHDVVTKVVEIIDRAMPEDYTAAKKRFDELKAQGRVEFVTFHQSYGYEDFIEGIRPVLNDESGESVDYKLHDGVFKVFCEKARGPSEKSKADFGLNGNPVIWKVSLEGTGENETRRDCLENGRIRIGWDDYGPTLDSESLQEAKEGRVILGAFVDGMSVGDIVLSCWSANEIDAIGVVTGEYEWHDEFVHYKRMRKVNWLVKDIRENILELNGGKKLTLSTVYRLNRVQLADVLALVAKHRGSDVPMLPDAASQPYVFVIDEINRGNVSKIFGELITLVEPSKRLGEVEETKAVLPYSGEEFGVPPNVFILGTMNTADRSIALLDTALRRRFDFIEMMPRADLLHGVRVTDSKGKDLKIDLEKMLQAMNGRIEYLLDREHAIGHAYFLPACADGKTMVVEDLATIFRKKIVPLLQEYFFEDYAKIRLVLGGASFKRKMPGLQFVTEEKGLAKQLFPGVPDDFGGPIDADRVLYRINEDAFGNEEAYRGIYQAPSVDEKTGPVAGKPVAD